MRNEFCSEYYCDYLKVSCDYTNDPNHYIGRVQFMSGKLEEGLFKKVQACWLGSYHFYDNGYYRLVLDGKGRRITKDGEIVTGKFELGELKEKVEN